MVYSGLYPCLLPHITRDRGLVVMKAAKKFAFDAGWVFAGSMVVLLLHFLQKPMMARYLGPDGLGLFSMVIMISGIIVLIFGLGINSAVIKYVAEYKSDKRKLNAVFSSAFITVAIFGVVTSVVLFVFSDKLADIFDMPSLSYLLKVYAFVLPFSLMYGVILGFLNGLREMKYYSLFNTLNNIMIFLFIFTFLFLGFGVVGAVIGDMLALIVVMVVAGIVMKKFVHFTICDYKRNTKPLISFGSRIMLGNTINEVNNQMDIIMIGYFLTVGDVGLYAVAISLARFFWRVPQSIQTITYPATTEYWAKGNYEALNKMVDKSMKYSACILLPIGLAVGFFANDIITLIFGGNFIYAVLPLQILLIGTVIRGIIAQPIGGSLPGIGRPDLSFKISAFVAMINIPLNVLFIPLFGISGAALATTISLIVGSIILLLLTTKLLSIKIDTKWYASSVGLVFAAIILFEFGIGFVNRYLLGGFIILSFLILIYIFFLTKEDRNLFNSIVCSFIRKG